MLISTLDVLHRCTSCANYSRDGLPNFFCAMHPFGVGVNAGTPNICPDWQTANFTLVLQAIETTFTDHPRTQGQTWRIMQLVQPPKQVMYAVVQVNEHTQVWAVYQWHSYNSIAPDPAVVVEEWDDFWRSIEWDAPYVVWTNSVAIDPNRTRPFYHSHRNLKAPSPARLPTH